MDNRQKSKMIYVSAIVRMYPVIKSQTMLIALSIITDTKHYNLHLLKKNFVHFKEKKNLKEINQYCFSTKY